MKSTFSIIFYLKRQVVKKDGTVPVMGRITVDGTQSQFSSKTTANPDLWDTKGGRMIGKSMQALEVNRKLDKMRVSISKHYQEIMEGQLRHCRQGEERLSWLGVSLPYTDESLFSKP